MYPLKHYYAVIAAFKDFQQHAATFQGKHSLVAGFALWMFQKRPV
jgi:hypothetical protein